MNELIRYSDISGTSLLPRIDAPGYWSRPVWSREAMSAPLARAASSVRQEKTRCQSLSEDGTQQNEDSPLDRRQTLGWQCAGRPFTKGWAIGPPTVSPNPSLAARGRGPNSILLYGSMRTP